MLSRIEISNFRSIADCTLSLSQETVIVGPNGVGKSNLLDAIHFMRDACRDDLDHAVTKRHGIESLRRWNKTRPYHITIKLEFVNGDESGSYKLTLSSGHGEFSVHEEEGHWNGRNPIPISGNSGETLRRSFSRTRSGINVSVPKEPFGEIKVPRIPLTDLIIGQFSSISHSPLGFYFQALHNEISNCGAYSIYPNRIREPQPISNSEVLADDGTNLASIIRQMRSTSSRANKAQLTSAIQQVLPIVEEIQVDSAGGFFVPVFLVREVEGGAAHKLNMSQLSDGTLRMLGMLTAFYQPNAPRRIAIEEPEQMIHPGILPILVDSGRDFLDAGDNRQLFYTTHSPTFLDLASPESIISVSFDDGVSTFNGISDRQLKIIKDRLFTAGELLVTEGITE